MLFFLKSSIYGVCHFTCPIRIWRKKVKVDRERQSTDQSSICSQCDETMWSVCACLFPAGQALPRIWLIIQLPCCICHPMGRPTSRPMYLLWDSLPVLEERKETHQPCLCMVACEVVLGRWGVCRVSGNKIGLVAVACLNPCAIYYMQDVCLRI